MQWVALQPLFEVYAREIEYNGGGHRRKVWWRQEGKGKKVRATLADSQEDKRRKRIGEVMGM